MEVLAAYIAIRATNEYANSALPNAPIRPDPAKRLTLRRLINAANRRAQGIRPAAAGTVGRIPAVRLRADKPAPDEWPGRVWQASPATQPVEASEHPPANTGAKSPIDLVS